MRQILDKAFRAALPLLASAAVTGVQPVAAQDAAYVNAARAFKGPQAHRDPKTGLNLYVESDGRHVAAIDSDGKILWVVDPFVEGKLEPYRRAFPRIVRIGAPAARAVRDRPGRFVELRFDSSQFGLLDLANGHFIFLGQD